MISTVRAGLGVLLTLLALDAQALVIGVTEGITYRTSEREIRERFEPIGEALSRVLKEPVTVRVISSYDGMRAALAAQEVDVAFIHPAHVALAAVKAGTYRSAAWTAGYTDYRVSFLCYGQPLKNWSELNGKRLVTPDPDSITAVMVRAMLRENDVPPGAVNVETTRYQDAVPFYVEHGFADYGATAAKAVIADWKKRGGQVCAESKPVPIKQWIVSTRLNPAAAQMIGAALTSLSESEAGRKALASSTYTGFVAPDPERERQIITWLGI